MNVLKLMPENLDTIVAEAARVLREGGVILYPTDTLYGLGADAFSNEAVARVYAIKRRDATKPVHAIVADIASLERYAEVDERARILAENFLPGPLTLVLKKKPEIDSGFIHGRSEIAFRIPANDFCLALAREFGRPYTTTSANVSGEETGPDVRAITKQLGTLANSLDLVVDAGKLPLRKPSTVVDLSGKEPSIIRDGAIFSRDIARILGL